MGYWILDSFKLAKQLGGSMSDISFACKNCNTQIECEAVLAGTVVQCPSCNTSVVVPRHGLYPGLEFGGFTLERKIGAGAMGEVWLAHHASIKRKIALKILSPSLTSDPDFVRQFKREVHNSSRLDHKNIVKAVDSGVSGDIHYLAMSFVDGESLEERICNTGKIPEKASLWIARDIACALNYAWTNFQLIHRDIKPSNIIVDICGQTKLMDMGVAKSLSEDASITKAGTIMGTPHYISPEQVSAEEVIDFRADIYSLGVTLFHMLEGKVPFNAKSSIAVMTKHLTDAPPLLHSLDPSISKPCEVLVQIMMAKNRDCRQKSWDDLIRDIDLVIEGHMPATQLPPQQDAQNPSEKASKSIARDEIKLPEAGAPPAKTPTPRTVVPPPPPKPSNLPWIKSAVVAVVIIIIALVIFLAFAGASKNGVKNAELEKQKIENPSRTDNNHK